MRLLRYLFAPLVLALFAPQAAKSEVYWEFQGAGMAFPNKHYDNGFDYMDKKPDGNETSFHAGLGIGLFIPLSQKIPLQLETGLQARVGTFSYFEKKRLKGSQMSCCG